MDSMSDFAKPSGKKGERILDSMDIDHSPRALWSLEHMSIREDDLIVDIGCGSGLNVKRLHERSPKAKTYGVDYSSTCVKKSIETNKQLVKEGCVEIVEANVLDMPFDDETFDIATAFSTVFFWPDIVNSFKEVKRILKNTGKFIMVQGMTKGEEYGDEENVFTNYSTEDFKNLLQEAEYSNITVITRKHEDEKISIERISQGSSSIQITDDAVDNAHGEIRFNQEWICIIAEK